MLTSDQINELKNELQKSKQQMEHVLEGHFGLLQSHAHDSTGELSSYDNHPADEATELYEREKDIALQEQARQELGDIQHALAAMANGSYGKCETCKVDIPFDRLEAIPTTTFCIEHTPKQQVSRNRPIEEEVISAGFIDRNQSIGYDTEDSWQEVASYGTSETPSDFARPPADYEDMYIESEENIGYVEDYENFAAVDMYGQQVAVYPNSEHEQLEAELDDEGIMTPFGDLPQYEHEPYVEE